MYGNRKKWLISWKYYSSKLKWDKLELSTCKIEGGDVFSKSPPKFRFLWISHFYEENGKIPTNKILFFKDLYTCQLSKL